MFLWQYLTPVLLITLQICKAQKCEEFTDLDLKHAFIGTHLRVKLLLYTRENRSCALQLSHTDLSATPSFNVSRPTTFIIHGYRPTGSPPIWINEFTQLLLERKDMNLIVVDWNRGAANVNYVKAKENTLKAGENLTALIKVMKNYGVSLDSIHIIGISLGAHIAGFVGANFNSSIGRITALDPAGPLFTGSSPENRLDPTDAQFVDVLHTDIDALGFRQPLGHIDFYPNDGTDQPGCPTTIFSGGAYFKCDHQRSVFLYMESIKPNCKIRTYPCSSYKDFLDGKCLNCEQFGPAGCPIFGYDVIERKDIIVKLSQIKTYFKTNPKSPFCMTAYTVDIVTWNQEVRFGYITIKLHSGSKESVATTDHGATKFKKFTKTQMLAHFDSYIEGPVDKISLTFTTGNVLQPLYKLRVLTLRLTPVETKDRYTKIKEITFVFLKILKSSFSLPRPLCRYDFILEENQKKTLRPIPCEDTNF
ncbi:lipase member H isoform X1 [Boleophthalmus pectinirostris]|uniref:lipase member H isoform X1 n=1 Tax=Boleophthalmus pectinirostris TaxID=150288 RepID=UPI00242B648D|nr:lipase member H isoform X1 [Boleophthalmus pectinirostris]XP_055004413.1 lipase member H isoform X1 [Boleophthalmus pectinirostris]